MKDRDQKSKALRYCLSKRWLPQLEVDVESTQTIGRRKVLVTDLDVFACIPDDFVGFRHVVFDCKTLARESPVNRSFWLRGVLDRTHADHGLCILKKELIEPDHKLAAAKLGVVLLSEDEFEIFIRATSALGDSPSGHSANIDLWERYFAIKDRFPSLEALLTFARSKYWMQTEPAEACRKIVAALYEVRTELDPAKAEHLSVVADICVLFARALAMMVSYLFRLYLHPKSQHELEEAVKVLLYGGRDAYEHRNQLYRMLKEKSGSNQQGEELALPEWGRFVQLVRQLLDAPGEASKAPLLLREIAFASLMNSSDLEFARTMSRESPQAARFAVLSLSYLAKATRLPPEFSSQLEGRLLGLLDR